MKNINVFCFGFGQVAKNFIKKLNIEKYNITLTTTSRSESSKENFKGIDYTGYTTEKYNTFMAPSTTSEIVFRIYVEKPYLEICKQEFENILEVNINGRSFK